MVGRYLADGYRTTGNKVGKEQKRAFRTIITSGHHEHDEVLSLVEKAGYKPSVSKERTSYKFNIGNKALWEFLEPFGRGAENKRLPGFVFDLPRDLLKALINGYVIGDGYKNDSSTNKNQWGITSISLELLTGIQQCIHKVYRTAPTISKSIVPPTKIIEGRTVNQKCFYTLKFYKETPKQANYYVDGDYIWTPFKSRERINLSVPVYNFEVADDNSYCVHNLIVHNCQSFSSAGQNLGIEDTRGTLFYETARIMQAKKPKYFIFENVKNLLSKKHERTFEIMCEVYSSLGYELDFEVINAKYWNVPQNRERVFMIGRLK